MIRKMLVLVLLGLFVLTACSQGVEKPAPAAEAPAAPPGGRNAGGGHQVSGGNQESVPHSPSPPPALEGTPMPSDDQHTFLLVANPPAKGVTFLFAMDVSISVWGGKADYPYICSGEAQKNIAALSMRLLKTAVVYHEAVPDKDKVQVQWIDLRLDRKVILEEDGKSYHPLKEDQNAYYPNVGAKTVLDIQEKMQDLLKPAPQGVADVSGGDSYKALLAWIRRHARQDSSRQWVVYLFTDGWMAENERALDPEEWKNMPSNVMFYPVIAVDCARDRREPQDTEAFWRANPHNTVFLGTPHKGTNWLHGIDAQAAFQSLINSIAGTEEATKKTGLRLFEPKLQDNHLLWGISRGVASDLYYVWLEESSGKAGLEVSVVNESEERETVKNQSNVSWFAHYRQPNVSFCGGEKADRPAVHWEIQKPSQQDEPLLILENSTPQSFSPTLEDTVDDLKITPSDLKWSPEAVATLEGPNFAEHIDNNWRVYYPCYNLVFQAHTDKEIVSSPPISLAKLKSMSPSYSIKLSEWKDWLPFGTSQVQACVQRYDETIACGRGAAKIQRNLDDAIAWENVKIKIQRSTGKQGASTPSNNLPLITVTNNLPLITVTFSVPFQKGWLPPGQMGGSLTLYFSASHVPNGKIIGEDASSITVQNKKNYIDCRGNRIPNEDALRFQFSQLAEQQIQWSINSPSICWQYVSRIEIVLNFKGEQAQRSFDCSQKNLGNLSDYDGLLQDLCPVQ